MRFYEYCVKPASGEILSAQIALSPETAALVTGTVLDPTEQPVPDALVLLLDQEQGDLIQSTLTDHRGRFYLGPVAPDTLYIVRVQLPGLCTRVLELNI